MKVKKRLDVLLTEQGYADSRSKAQAIIMSGRTGQSRQSMDHNNVLCVVKAGNALPEDRVEPAGKCLRHFPAGGCIAVSAQAGQLLDDTKLLDIPGDGCLGAGETGVLQQLQKLFLCFHVGGGDDLQNFSLSL